MWPFPAKTDPETEKRLSDRVADLEKRLETIEVEWSEWFDKYRRLYARLAKRQERDAKTSDDPPEPRTATGGHSTPAGPVNGFRRNLRGF